MDTSRLAAAAERLIRHHATGPEEASYLKSVITMTSKKFGWFCTSCNWTHKGNGDCTCGRTKAKEIELGEKKKKADEAKKKQRKSKQQRKWQMMQKQRRPK